MDLATIVARTAEGLVAVDSSTQIINANRRTGEPYLPGVPTLNEPQFVAELLRWWQASYPQDFLEKQPPCVEFPYGNGDDACDLVLRSPLFHGPEQWEWAIEYKYIRLVGNNGKNNDYGVAKAVSPYRKDRSFVHDALRLSQSSLARNKAAIIYGFEYDRDSVTESATISAQIGAPDYSKNILSVIRSVDPVNQAYQLGPLEEIIHDYLLAKRLTSLPPETQTFSGATRHPCGGKGIVYAWLIR